MNSNLLGAFGEAQTAEYLRKHGFHILAMNYRTRLGEIDIIASNRQYLSFVEVKLRKNARFAQAREFVNYSKQQRIIAAAQEWLQENGTELQPRFDVMEIYAPHGASAESLTFHYIENAFELN